MDKKMKQMEQNIIEVVNGRFIKFDNLSKVFEIFFSLMSKTRGDCRCLRRILDIENGWKYCFSNFDVILDTLYVNVFLLQFMKSNERI